MVKTYEEMKAWINEKRGGVFLVARNVRALTNGAFLKWTTNVVLYAKDTVS